MSTRSNVGILADENISRSAIRALRVAGYDVVAVTEQRPGLADEDVLLMAQSDHRLIITHDKDFGASWPCAGVLQRPLVSFYSA